jgi:hypothetical protein
MFFIHESSHEHDVVSLLDILGNFRGFAPSSRLKDGFSVFPKVWLG